MVLMKKFLFCFGKGILLGVVAVPLLLVVIIFSYGDAAILDEFMKNHL